MARTPDGHGYWLVASDGGIFTYGDAPFEGSLGIIGTVLGIAVNPSTDRYGLVMADGTAQDPSLTPPPAPPAPTAATTSAPPSITSSPTGTTRPQTTTTTAPPPKTTTTTPPTAPPANTPYPVGTASSAEPSGMAPPSATALPGFTETYSTDFPGSALPSGWDAYSGPDAGDPGGQLDPSHAVVGGGLLQLNAFQDPAYNNQWVTGGVCHCGHPELYGAFFVRSRVTGAGPTNVELLWPSNGTWPPEIDFNETLGGATTTTSATIYGSGVAHGNLSIDMTQWHTWGVVWTPTSVTYTVDGHVWGSVTVPSEVPSIAMWLALQQQTWCSSGYACPSAPESMDIDWVSEYSLG